MFQEKFAIIWWWPQNCVSIENNDLDIVYPLNPLFLSSVDKLLTSASVFFIAFVCLQEFLFQFNDKDYVGDDAVENQGNALVKGGWKSIINWPEYLSIINWLEYLSIYQLNWTFVNYQVIWISINLPELGRCSLPFCSGCSKLKPNSLLTFLWMKNISFFMWTFLKQFCLLTHGQVNLWGLIRNRQWTAITPFDYHQSSY